MLTNTTEIGTAMLPRRRLTIPAPTDVSPSAPRRVPRFPALAWAALALLGLLAHPSPAAAQTDVWTATLTPADFGSGLLGCNNASATSKCSTATVLSDDDFTYDSTDYSVTTLYLNATAFTLTVDTDITDATNALTVVVGSTSLAFADATQTARTRTWFNPGFSWTAGTAVSIRIPDTTPPELTSAAVAADGNSITVTFDESVDQTNLPAAGAFSVAADGAPVTVSGVSAGTAAQLVLVLAAPGIRAGQVVTLGYTDPTAGDDTSAVQDTSGNDAVSFSDYSVTNNSIVVTVPSDWSLKPTGLAVGARFRLLFLSSTKRDGSSSDIADYNTFVQARAAAGHADIRTYSTGFRAVGCTADTDARDTTYTTYTSTDKGVPIYWLNGAKAADQYEDFYDGTWDDEVNDKNESGTNGPNTSLEANYPLTGCNDRGTEYFDRFNRSSALAKIEVMVGRPNSSAAASHGPLSSNTALDVSNTVSRPMYGLSAVFEVAPDTTPPTLTSADVEETNGLTIYLEFSEDLQLSNPPLASAFTLTVDGSAVTGFSVAWPGSLLPQNAIWLGPPTAIRQGQAVVVTYTDPTAGNDTAAIQDTTGNDAADFTTGMNSVPAVINNSTVANAVLAGWSLTPTGLAVGDQFRLLFLSSTKRDAAATDIATYNTFIQTRAAAGHTDIQAYSAGFRVVGCTAATDARDNTETTYTSTAKGVPIYWLNGAKAADEYEDFYDGSWDDEANDKNESGTDAHDTSQTANWPWTGCNHNGTEFRQFAGTVSRGLGSNNDVRYGRPDSSTVNHGPLNGLQNGPKAENRPLYGLSALFQVVGEDTTPPTLTSADVEITDALIINLVFSEDLQLSNPPALSAFTVTVDGSAATVSSVGVPGSVPPQNELWLQLSTAIRQRQAVVVTYTDATSGDDTAAIQDTAGNDAATFTTGMDGVPAVTNNSTVTKTVPADWSLIPTGLSTGDKFRLLFLSSTKRNSTATDIATYNTFIQTRAAAGHTDIQDYSADFRAVGCTADTDARDNTKTTYTTTDKGVPIYWLNGAKAADQYEDFYDGSWDDEANDKNESGTNAHDTSQNVNWPWTGCDHDGTEAVTSGDSFALGTNLVDARVGRPNSSASGHGPLNGQTNRSNFQNSPLYGLSEVFQVAAAVVVPNNPPTFSADTAARSVAENTAAGQNVGAALTATDADSDTLTYTLEGTDAASFDIVSGSGQIRTRTGVTYNHEAKSTHTVVVKADDGNGGTDTVTVTITVTDVDEPPGQPAAPSVSATAGSSTSLDVTWTAPTNTGPAIASYDLQYRAGTSGNFTNGPQNVTGTSAAIGSLAADTSYEVQVRATNAEGDGDWSVAGTGRTTASVPGAPTGLTATASGATQIDLSWSAPGSTGGSAITGYRIEVSSNGTSGWTDQVANTNSTATTYAHTGLAAGDTRHYRVSAINTNGAGTASNVANATTDASVPGAPTGLTATASGTTAINLSWSAPGSTGGSAITGYRIEVSSDGGSSWSDLVANTSNTTTTYAHTGLGGGTTRHYRVSAINTNGAGTASNVANATTDATAPGAPTGLTATASGATQIDLSWSAPGSTGGSAITGYKIEVSPNGTSGWTNLVANTSNTTTTYAHTGLAAGDTRHYRVSAINTNGTGVPSNVDSATTGTSVPGAPTGLTATASGATQIDLSWSAPGSTGGSAITGYKIEVSPNGTSGWTDQVANTNSTTTTYAHTGLAAGDTRHYRVSAINTNGTGVPSNVDSATTGTSVPGAPTGLTATASGATQIDLSWSAPGSTGGSAITGYRIEVSSNGTSSWTNLVANTSNTATTYAHTGLAAGDTRHYRVSAINTNGTGTASNVDSATTGTSVPGAPTGLTATASGTTAINLSWSAPGSTGGSAITGYKIEVSPNGTSGWTDQVADTNSTATTYAHTGLAAGDTRHYRVSAINTNGTGTASNVDSATTGTSVPGAPTGLTATASGTTAINLSWSAPGSTGGSAITGYKIEVSPNGTSGWTDQVADTNSTATTYAHTGLAAGDTRHYRVSAINTNGAGDPSNVANATTGATAPGAPTGLTATASGTTAINLSWSAPASTGGSAITGYKIEVSPNGTSGWTDQVADTNSTATTYAHTGLAAGDTRHYRVSAINTNGAGTASNVANATTGQTTVTFGASSYTAAEGGATATVAVQLSAAASATVTIPLTKTHRGGATAADYSGVPSNVTFTAGQTRRTFTVTATDDADKDGGESVQLGFGTLPGGYAPGARRTATVTLVDDDANLIVNFGTERHTTVKVLESDTVWHRFIFSLSTSRDGPPNGNPQQPVTIPLVVTHRGGATPADYEVRGRRTLTSVTFGVGESVTSFSMRAIPDGRRETGEGLRLDFGRLPAGVRKGTWGPHETIEFVDQELPGYTVLFGAEAYTATEGGAPARVSIHLSEPVEIEPLVVRLVVTHVGATAADYTGIPKSVRFEVGEQTQTITVKATDDTDDDDGESVTLSFVNDPNGRVRVRTGPASATVALADNDGLRRVTVSFGAVTYTATEGGADATVRVELDAAPGRSVTVPLTKAHLGNATAADYSGIPMNVTFAANQTSRTFAVMATAGDGSDGGESVSIGFGTLPEGVFAGSPAATTVTLADGSEQRLVVNFGSSRGHTVQVREGARRLRLNVLLDSSPRRPVTIPLVVTHVGGATAADYAAIPESVTFAAGQTSAHYYVRALPDEEDETGEGLQLDFGPLPPGVRKGTWGPYETIDFLDPAPAANLSVSRTVVTVGFPGALDGGSTPSPRDFVVSVEAPGGEKAMAPVAAVAVEGSDVFLQLARPVAPDDTVTLSYLADAMHPIRDEAGSPAAPLTDAPVRNQTPASGLGPEAGLRVQAGCAAEKDRVPKRRTVMATCGLAGGTQMANPAPLAALLEAAQVGAGTGRLDLSSRHLTDITALAGLTGLRELDLRDNAIEDLWPLAGLRGLEALYLSGNQISDLRPLAGLRGLKVLDLAGNRIEDLWPLSGLTELRELDLADNAVADLGPLAGLAGLEALDLAGNRISDVWGPGYLTRLERLNLADNAIEDLRPLARLTLLEVLLLDRNRITDVLALSPMAELANLGLAGNQIANLWPLEGLGQLHRLDLSGNAAADPSALGRVENLRWLWLDPAPAAELEAAPGPDSGPRIIVVEQRGGIFRNPLPSDADRKFEWNGGPQAY